MSYQSPSDRKPKLTVAMIVRNAEALVASTLSCVRDIADEIIVADTGSTDGTQAIVASLADRLVEFPWTDDFSTARNALMRHATGDWILWLDAGETLSDHDLAVLRSHIDMRADSGLAYMSLVRLPSKAGDVSGEQVGRIRLLPRHPELKFSGRVRESLRPALDRLGLQVASLPITILRSQIDHLPQVKRAKAERDIRIADLAMQQAGALPALLLAKGEAKMTLQKGTEARKLYQQAKAASVPQSSEMLEAYYGELTTYDGEENARQMQIKLCLAALEMFPLDAQLLCAMGSYLQAEERIDLATRAYETCVRFGQVNPEIWHLADITEVVTICLSLCLQQQRQDDRARRVLEEGIELRPESQKLPRHLIDLHIKHGRRQDALELINTLPPEATAKEAFRSAVRGACLAVEKNWIAAKAYLQTAYHGGCREAACFRWLIVTHLALGDYRAAEKMLESWCELEPNQVEVERYRQAIQAQRSGEPPSALTTQAAAASSARPVFTQAPGKISATGQSMRFDPPAAPSENAFPPVAPLERRPAAAPRSFTIDTPARD